MSVRRKKTVYIRTILSLTLATAFVFAVLSFVYYQRMSSAIIVDESEHLFSVTQGLADGLSEIRSSACVINFGSSRFEALFLNSNAVVQNKYMWVVDASAHGDYLTSMDVSDYDSTDAEARDDVVPLTRMACRIDYFTGIPDQVSDQLIFVDDVIWLPSEALFPLFENGSGVVLDSRNYDLFEDARDVWISSSYPIKDSNQYLIIHRSINVEQIALEMLSNSLALPLGISFALALLLFTLMTHSIVRPIRLMSDLAQNVAQGDWSFRIRSKDVHVDSPFKYLIVDEISTMISTMNEMIDKLERQETDRRLFISSLAHDLRTPLTSINGFLTAIMDGTIPPEKCEHYMSVIKGEVERIQKLTAMMTEASSVGQPENLQKESIDVNEMIKEALNNFEHQLRQKELGVQLDLFTNERNQLLAYADRQAIMRVLYNLITNAIKFTPHDGNILITTYYELSESQITISVEDSGPGISPDHRYRVFESFYKTDESRTDSGSGLGLFICKEILRAHNQAILVESGKELGGARFVFTLEGAPEMKE